MLKADLTLKGYSGERVVICPRCGSDYMHHQEVIRWDRSEDATIERYTFAGSERTEVKAVPEATGNPSSRRGGLIVSFSCEGCGSGAEGDRLEMVISQHKGQTEIEWRFDPRRSKD